MPIYLVPYGAEAEGKEKAMQRTKNDMASLCVDSFRQTGQGDKQTCWQACKWVCVCEFDSANLFFASVQEPLPVYVVDSMGRPDKSAYGWVGV